MQYDHTQKGPLHIIVYATSVILAAGAWFSRDDSVMVLILLGSAVIVAVLGPAFHYLRVRDEGDRLAVRFGPLPLFRKCIPYSAITAVEPDRSGFLDGWGIHYMPGKGWIYNLWGFQCVRVYMGKKMIRIGSDDVENLVEFLHGKVQKPN